MIEFVEITKSYAKPGGGRILALPQTSLKLNAGEAAALAGGSGCGKTTLMNIAAGLLRPDQGKVLICGNDLYALGEAKRDRFRAGHIGYVFQNFNLLPSLSAWENVMAALWFGKTVPKRERAARCRELLSRVGLQERMRHRPVQLSGGEQQRVCIARALANHPPVLLADEPTANLDAENRRNVSELLFQVCREEGIALLVATHDAELLKCLPRVIWLETPDKQEGEENAV